MNGHRRKLPRMATDYRQKNTKYHFSTLLSKASIGKMDYRTAQDMEMEI